MPWIEIALPGLLLLAKFILKLVVDRTATLPDLISAILALPVDIVFLSASLLAGHAISSPGNKEGLIFFLFCICVALVIVVLWRRSDREFTRDRYVIAGGLCLVNVAVSATILICSLSLLTPGGSQ